MESPGADSPRNSFPVHYKTEILTDQGEIRISKLDGKDVKIWNGFSWRVVHVRKARANHDLIKIKVANGTEEGLELKCTPNHPFYMQHENGILLVKAGFLLCGMKLVQWFHPSLGPLNQIVRGVEGKVKDKETYHIEPSGGMCILNGILTGI